MQTTLRDNLRMKAKNIEKRTEALRKKKMSTTTGNDNKDRAKIKPSSTAPNPFSPIVFSFTFPVRSVPQPSPFVQIQQFCTTPYSSVCVTCAGISPTYRENARSSSDPGTAVEDKIKSKIQTVLKKH